MGGLWENDVRFRVMQKLERKNMVACIVSTAYSVLMLGKLSVIAY